MDIIIWSILGVILFIIFVVWIVFFALLIKQYMWVNASWQVIDTQFTKRYEMCLVLRTSLLNSSDSHKSMIPLFTEHLKSVYDNRFDKATLYEKNQALHAFLLTLFLHLEKESTDYITDYEKNKKMILRCEEVIQFSESVFFQAASHYQKKILYFPYNFLAYIYKLEKFFSKS